MNTVCLSCLNKISTEEKSHKTGTEIYHNTCYINKVMSKAYKYANQIKLLEPDQIVSQLFGSDKFKLSNDELELVKSIYNSSNSTNTDINIDEDIIILKNNAMYNSLSNSTNSSLELFKNFSKNELKTLIDSSLNLMLTDNVLFEQIIGENPMSSSFETTFSNSETISDKLMESLPDELKNKIINFKNQIETSANNFSFFGTVPIGNLVKTDADTESDSGSEFEQPDLD